MSVKLNDIEKRIFLSAMNRELEVCKQIDKDMEDEDGINLVKVCQSIERKIKENMF